MSKLSLFKALFATLLIISLAACKNAGEDIKVVVDMNIIKYSTLLHIADATGTPPQNITLAMGGEAGSDIYEISGKKVFAVKDGIITLGLNPKINPTASKQISYNVTIASPGYKSLTVPMSFKDGELQQMVTVTLEKVAANGPATVAPVVPVPTAPVTTTPSVVTPVTTAPVTTTPATTVPVAATPVTASPIINTPITNIPVTTTPVKTTPPTSTPVTTAPVAPIPVTNTPVVVEPVPVKVALDFVGFCSNKPNLKIRPSLYVFYRKKGAAVFQFLGFMKDGHLDANLALDVTYDFQITYAGQSYTISGRMNDTYYQDTFNMGAALCSTF